MPLKKLDNFILWLLPDQAGTEYFSNVISVLAKKYQSDPFLPHITIGRVPDIQLPEIKHKIDNIGLNADVFDVKVKRVWCREKPSEKISVEIESSPHLQNLLSFIDEEFHGAYGKREYPHLSLLYGNDPCSSLKTDVEQLNHMILNRFKISAIALVDLHGSPDEWSVSHRAELGS